MKARSIKGDSAGEIQVALDQGMAGGFKPTLAILFLSVKQDREAVVDLLEARGIQVFGATTAGEFIDGDIGEGSIAMLLLDMDPGHFKLEFIDIDPDTAFEDAKRLGEIARQSFPDPALIVATGGVFIDGDQVMGGIMHGYGSPASSAEGEVTIFGGMAGDDLLAEKPLVFIHGKCHDNALIALIIDKDKMDVRGLATCGWNAIGTPKTVTRSEGNIVYTIDDKPALDMLMKYLGVDVRQEDNDGIVAFLNSWYYPLQVERANGDRVIRATRFANRENRSLICTGSVPQGAKIRFAFPPDFEAIDTVVAECESIKDDPRQQADALILFSCVSRHLSFGDLMKEEIERVQNVWKAPMAGFFTYGEFGRSQIGNNEFHNNACCVVALREKGS